MKIISRVKIERFRSLKLIDLEHFSDFTVLAGLNNSGKSNVLRALNAFFNDLTEYNNPIIVDSDYFRGGGKVKRKRQISVTVYFELPDQFKFRSNLTEVEKFLGGKKFSIKKQWVRDEPNPRLYLNEGVSPLNLDDRQKILQFLSLISFRYIPNRVVPTDIIKQEHQALRDVLIRQLGSKKAERTQAFESFVETSTRLIKGLTNDFRSILPEIKEIRLSTPMSWEEMIFAFGYRLKESSVEFDEVSQGSGIQSLLMFETLHLIDKDYRQRFGWRQASIWAVEEPESSLHSSLEAHTALLLSGMAHDAKNRLQILATTHSDLMIQYADNGYLVQKMEEGSKLEAMASSDLLNKSAAVGISRWVHPILHHPLTPLYLVDGKFDEIFITQALKVLELKLNGNIYFLEKLQETDGATGGNDATLHYIKTNQNIIKARQKSAPVIIVLDWEDINKKANYDKLFNKHDPFRVIIWPEGQANPNLSKKFRGIERFYSDKLIRIAEKEGVNISRNKKGVVTIDKEDYERAKSIMIKHIEKHGLSRQDLVYAESFLRELVAIGGNLHSSRTRN